MSVDVLAIGAHPDDVELGVGGTLLSLAHQGFSIAILDLTRGELSSRGSMEERMREADEAADRLNIEARYNAELPDGAIHNMAEQQQKLIPFIRTLRPHVILIPRARDRHPDHRRAHDLVRDANFFSGVASVMTEDAPHRAGTLYAYNAYYDDEIAPQIVMDVSDFFEQKLEALKAYRSQLHNPGYSGPATFVSSQRFWDAIRKRAAYWGHRIGVDYGEPLYTEGPLPMTVLPGLEVST